MKIAVEIELSEEEAKKLDELIEARTLDREKFLKRLLADGIRERIEKRGIALAQLARERAPLLEI
jgi:predicted transcriptional regulator